MIRRGKQYWFLLRISYSSQARLLEMKERLDAQDDILETYVPLGFVKVKRTKMDFAPILLNYIFVRSTYDKLLKVKHSQYNFESLRFVMHPVMDDNYNEHDEALFIPDRKMQDYMRITREENEKVIFLDNMIYACKPSQEVQITEGEFAGVMGRIKRIKGRRCVVIPIGNEFAAAVVDVPNKHLRYLSKEEVGMLLE